MDKYYVYAWFIKNTNHIFYIGKGHKSRCSCKIGRNDRFLKTVGENDCDYLILKYCNSEQEAYKMENVLILYFKSIGQADANISAGDERNKTGSEHFASKEEHEKFIEKMTVINKERCGKDDYRELHRKLMTERYSDENERKIQSEKIRKSWSNKSLRKKQSEIIKKSYTPELLQVRKEAMERRTVFELNDEKIVFKSQQECIEYLKLTYDFSPSRRTILALLRGETYSAYHKRFKCLDGMKIYYE